MRGLIKRRRKENIEKVVDRKKRGKLRKRGLRKRKRRRGIEKRKG